MYASRILHGVFQVEAPGWFIVFDENGYFSHLITPDVKKKALLHHSLTSHNINDILAHQAETMYSLGNMFGGVARNISREALPQEHLLTAHQRLGRIRSKVLGSSYRN